MLVVYKKSLYRLYVEEHQDQAIRTALRRGDPVACRLKRSHNQQERSLAQVKRVLDRRHIEAQYCWRGSVRSTRGYDLIIAVGGDGTLLDTACYVQSETPLLGINSDPEYSVGSLCAGQAPELEQLLEAYSSGTLRPERRTRIAVRVDGRPPLGPYLNDVLVAHESPAEMSRFQLGRLAAEEAETLDPAAPRNGLLEIRSSGLWIATATGSTAALRSAGGAVMPPVSRRLQYWVREPYAAPDRPHPEGARGFVAPDQALVIINRMRRGRLWGDGPHRRIKLDYGQRILVQRHPIALSLIRRP